MPPNTSSANGLSVVRPTFCRSAVNADGRVQAYHGREEVRAQPAPSRHQQTRERHTQAFIRCNGLLDRASIDSRFTVEGPSRLPQVRLRESGEHGARLYPFAGPEGRSACPSARRRASRSIPDLRPCAGAEHERVPTDRRRRACGRSVASVSEDAFASIPRRAGGDARLRNRPRHTTAAVEESPARDVRCPTTLPFSGERQTGATSVPRPRGGAGGARALAADAHLRAVGVGVRPTATAC